LKTNVRAKITALGSYVPPRVLTNSELEKMVDTTNEWILERTGIRERHLVDPGMAASDLATAAALDLAQSFEPDVVISDVVMPGVDGIALALKATKDRPAMPVVLMTGFAEEQQRAHNLEALIDVSAWLEGVLGRRLDGLLYRAGVFPGSLNVTT